MTLKHFGTDGIRGEYGGPKLNDSIAYRAGAALAELLKRSSGIKEPKLIVGRDTRHSGERLLRALASGFRSGGGSVDSIGVAPTPAIAKLVATSDAQAGCSITASHNPHTDNGLKFFGGDGTKLSESLEQEFDDALDTIRLDEIERSGTELIERKGSNGYSELLLVAFPAKMLAGKRIGIDCANGALSLIAADVFESLGAKVDRVGCSPDGSNINEGVGSEHPNSVRELYRTNSYDMCFAFDGDGDRVIAFDHLGKKLSGEAVLGLLAIQAKSKNLLVNDTLVTTIQSNLGLDAALRERGISVERVDIGDKFVSRRMLANGYSLGGEESGHIVMREFSMTGDGLFAALKIAEAVVGSGESLEKLASFYRAFPQQTRAIRVASKLPLESCNTLQATISKWEESLGPDGRLLVRYSGTEPKIRLLVEAKSSSLVENAIADLENAVAEDLG